MEGQDGKGVPGITGRFFTAAQVPSPPRAHSTEGVAECQTDGFVMKNIPGGKAPQARGCFQSSARQGATPHPQSPTPTLLLKALFPDCPRERRKQKSPTHSRLRTCSLSKGVCVCVSEWERTDKRVGEGVRE